MKNLIKVSIKLLFVVILPVIITISVVYLLKDSSAINGGAVSWVLAMTTLLIVYANAFMYLGWMSSTNILPKVTGQFLPVFGFAMAYDNHDKWILIVPFYTIEFQRKDKNQL